MSKHLSLVALAFSMLPVAACSDQTLESNAPPTGQIEQSSSDIANFGRLRWNRDYEAQISRAQQGSEWRFTALDASTVDISAGRLDAANSLNAPRIGRIRISSIGADGITRTVAETRPSSGGDRTATIRANLPAGEFRVQVEHVLPVANTGALSVSTQCTGPGCPIDSGDVISRLPGCEVGRPLDDTLFRHNLRRESMRVLRRDDVARNAEIAAGVEAVYELFGSAAKLPTTEVAAGRAVALDSGNITMFTVRGTDEQWTQYHLAASGKTYWVMIPNHGRVPVANGAMNHISQCIVPRRAEQLIPADVATRLPHVP